MVLLHEFETLAYPLESPVITVLEQLSITSLHVLFYKSYLELFSYFVFLICIIKDMTDVSIVIVTATYTEAECATVIL